MSFDEFVAKWNGKGIDFDKAYGDQCMDLMHQYHVEVLGITDGRTLAAPGAKDVYLQFESRFNNSLFEKIPNTPTGVPQKGDIVLWGEGIGPFGHVAMFVSGDTNKFKSFDQNFPTGSKCKIVEHTYKGVLGWLRFKGSVNTVQVEADKFTELVDKSTKYDSFFSAGYITVDDVLKKVGELNAEIEEFKRANKTLNDKITDLAQAIEKDSLEDADVVTKLIDTEHDRDEYKKELVSLYMALGVSTTEDSLAIIAELKKPNDDVVREYSKLGKALEAFIDESVEPMKNIFIRIVNKFRGR
jgi:hypothetical protein